jgi:peptide/nickel transport system permease protein
VPDALDRFLAQRGARFGLGILVVLATLAAWAPFLANDKPYVLVAADHRAAERARTELVPLSLSCADALASARSADAAADARALGERLAALEEAGAADLAAPVRAALARASRAAADSAADAAAGLVAAARAARAALEGRPLAPPLRRTYPLFASLDALDILAALAPIAGLFAWRSARRAGLVRALAVGAAPLVLVAALAGLGRDAPALAAQGALKEAAARGTLRVESALFPPIPFGPAETNLAEAWRAPTWLPAGQRGFSDGAPVDGASSGGASSDGASGDARAAARAAPADAQPAAQPTAQTAAKPYEPAFDAATRHLLGTDAVGRDVAARVLWGGRRSLAVATSAALLLFFVGALLGAAAGAWGGLVDAAVLRVVEVVLCFPAFFLVLCAVAWADSSVVPVQLAVALVIAAVGWTTTARLVRAEALRVAASGHVLAARALGLSPLVVLVRHVLPNAIGPGLVAFGFAAGGAIGVESSLAFLGLGADVAVPTWGALVGAARGADQAWAWIPPGLCVFLAVLAWVLVAEAARAAVDPRGGGAPG